MSDAPPQDHRLYDDSGEEIEYRSIFRTDPIDDEDLEVELDDAQAANDDR